MTEQMLSAIEHTNLLASRATEHSKASARGTWGKRSVSPVVLGVAKDLIAARYRHEILRYAQDDTRVLASFALQHNEWAAMPTKP